ncbi:ribosomal protein L21-like protein [Podospora appendiculata]|uniref:Large ribosomal subunit protein bL21m n=1 Tax=Podospora appendiculata TaxID=314037 RepID=A0AAE0XII7_9PEZI|nr:ribosomal protein L21-like protein [Podospora appendiculata]
MSRALLRSVLELRTPITRLPPAFLLPMPIRLGTTAARFFNQTAQIIEPVSQPPPAAAAKSAAAPASPSPSVAAQAQQLETTFTLETDAPAAPSTTPAAPLDESIRTLLPLLAAQPGHYVTIHIHGRPYLVTEGDSIRLPFKMPGAEPGDVLRLNRASVVGSRDYTLQGAPYVDERLFACRAIVTGTEAEPMRVVVKKKRRTRRTTHKFSKLRFTMLRISELKIANLAEIES